MNNFDSKKFKGEILDLVRRYSLSKKEIAPFQPGVTVVPPSGKLLGPTEYANMVDAVLDGWLTTGRFNDQFEQRLARYIGVKHLLTTNSGSSANLLAFSALTSRSLGERAIRPGDEVISVAAAFPTTVNPILQYGAIPVFVDVAIPSYNIDPDKIEVAITSKTKAIMLAHTLGNPFNLYVIKSLCDKYQLWLIEDCCDALGSMYDGKMVGSFGDIGTLSFYPAHHITMGEGGAVFTNNAQLKRVLLSLRDWGRDCHCEPGNDNSCNRRYEWQLGELPYGYDHKYIYSHMGYNLKISDIQAACGLAQLDSLEDFINSRKENFRRFTTGLASCSHSLILPQPSPDSDPSWFGYPITVNNTATYTRLELLRHLDSKNIGTRLLFAGNLTRQPYMKHQNYRISGNLENTDRVMEKTFWIGLYPGITTEMLNYVCTVITNFVTSNTQ